MLGRETGVRDNEERGGGGGELGKIPYDRSTVAGTPSTVCHYATAIRMAPVPIFRVVMRL